jgi:hypothetical protein
VGPATVHRLRKLIIKPTWTASAKRLRQTVNPGWPWAKALAREVGILRIAQQLPTAQCQRDVLFFPPMREIRCFWHRVPGTPWAIQYTVAGELQEYLVLLVLVRA